MTTCDITGLILDSASQPVNGLLVVTIDSAIANDTGGSIERFEAPFIINAGVVDIELEETETRSITYHFQFFKRIGTGTPAEYESQAIPDFHAMVPKLPAYTWSKLREQTGISTASLSTAALVVGRELLTNPTLAAIVNQGLAYYRSSAPPVLTVNATWVDLDTYTTFQHNPAEEKYYSGIQTQVFTFNNVSANTEQIVGIPKVSGFSGIQIVNALVSFTNSAPLSGGAYYTIRFGIILINTSSKTELGNIITNNGVPAVNFRQNFPIDSFRLISNVESFYVELIKLGSPGNVNVNVSFNYQTVH